MRCQKNTPKNFYFYHQKIMKFTTTLWLISPLKQPVAYDYFSCQSFILCNSFVSNFFIFVRLHVFHKVSHSIVKLKNEAQVCVTRKKDRWFRDNCVWWAEKNTVNSAAGIEQHILFFFNLLLFSFACVWLMVQDFIFGNVISAHNTVAERLWVDAWL